MEPLLSRKDYPEEKELVIGVVDEVFKEIAYILLPEYDNKKAFLHISEASEKWLRDIRDELKEGQLVVCKVIRVDKAKGFIDVSLRHIPPRMKKKKLFEFKRKRKIHSIAKSLAQRLGLSLREIYEQVVWPLEDKYGDAYYAFETAAIYGDNVLKEVIKDKKLVSELYNEIKKKFVVKEVYLKAKLQVFCVEPDGIERIKKTFLNVLKKYKNKKLEAKYVSAPDYLIKYYGIDYKEIDKELTELCEHLIKEGKKNNVIISYKIERD